MQPIEILKESQKEFDTKFPFAIIDWKLSEENDGDGTSVDKMKEIKSHLTSLTIKLLEGITERLTTIKEHEYTNIELKYYIQSLESQLSEIKQNNENIPS